MGEGSVAAEREIRPAPVGIGGWLIWPAIGIVLTPIVLGASLIIVGTSISDMPPRYSGYLTFCMLLELGLLVYSLIVANMFFRKKTSAPGAYISLMILSLLVAAGTTIVGVALGLPEFLVPNLRGVGGSVVGCAIWIPYFKKSARVKATFTK